MRLYLYGGADRVATEGPAGGPITLRVVGGPGNDALDDSKSGGTRVYDFEGASVVKGPGTHVDTTPWKRQPAKPKETPWLEWRDWGSRTLPQYKAWWEPDPGVILAAGLAHQTWGFRKFPYASLQTVQLQYSLGRSAFKFNYDGEFRRENSKLYFVLDLQASQLENLNYFGLGNELSNTPPEGQGEDYFDVESDDVPAHALVALVAQPHLRGLRGSRGEVDPHAAGPERVLRGRAALRHGDFGQVGVRGGFDLDTRGHRLAGTVGDQFRSDGKPAASGVRLKAEGFYYPEAWDVTDAFGGVDGQLRGYLVGKRAMLAARVGGRQVWGEYPWFEAAFIGGSRNLRGYRKNRFGGDSSLYGSLEARLWLFRGRLIAPGRWGVFGLTDVGRVYLEGESSDEWHASYGGGIFFQMHTLNTDLPRGGGPRGRRDPLLRRLWLRVLDPRPRSDGAAAPGREPLALAALLALPTRAAAQDSHYWSIQYGPVGQLVGGQLIGGGPDLSATYYNPGALVLRNESSYLLSTESVQWELVSTEAQPGLEVLDSSSSTFGAAPSLLAGVLPRWLGEDTSLAWSFLTRQKFHVRLGERVTDPIAAARRARAPPSPTSTRGSRRAGPGSRSRAACRTPWASV